MMTDYDPKDWYWIVGGDESRVFSSARGGFFPVGDATYQAWLRGGGFPTRIASKAELGEVLAPHFARPEDADVLDAYKDSQATKLTVETVAKVTFNHENRLRALEGKQPINGSQFKTALKDLM